MTTDRTSASSARRALEDAQRQLKQAEQKVQQIERDCQHDWDVKNEPIYDEGYTCPGDPPGTMGVDWRGPVYVEPKTTPRWIRTCKTCGKVEHTCVSKQETRGATLDVGTRTTAQVTVPDWSRAQAGRGREGFKNRRW